MKNDKLLRFLSSLLSIFLYFLYVCLWLCVCCYGFLILVFRGVVLRDYYGIATMLIAAILGFILLFAPFYVRKFVKPEWKTALISIGSCLVYALIIGLAIEWTSVYFSEFSTAKWLKYPNERRMMIESLEKNFNIIGMEEEKIIPLLGEPYSQNEGEYVYFVDVGLIDPMFYVIIVIDGRAVETIVYES